MLNSYGQENGGEGRSRTYRARNPRAPTGLKPAPITGRVASPPANLSSGDGGASAAVTIVSATGFLSIAALTGRAASRDHAGLFLCEGDRILVRLTDLPDALRALVQRCEVPTHTDTPWTPGVPMAEQRVAIVSTAGLQRAGDRPFDFDSDDYRVIPGDVDPATILMSHISSDFDRSGFQQDINVVLPLQRLQEMAAEGEIASVAGYHYSFMGATHPDDMEERARQLAGLMKADCVNTVLLAPV